MFALPALPKRDSVNLNSMDSSPVITPPPPPAPVPALAPVATTSPSADKKFDIHQLIKDAVQHNKADTP